MEQLTFLRTHLVGDDDGGIINKGLASRFVKMDCEWVRVTTQMESLVKMELNTIRGVKSLLEKYTSSSHDHKRGSKKSKKMCLARKIIVKNV
ncbi:MAG: hypothetical protein IPP37_11065 [Saprospiraceae bacterium]|nr:hypothetical protein [Saprospiraceae bacterium]